MKRESLLAATILFALGCDTKATANPTFDMLPAPGDGGALMHVDADAGAALSTSVDGDRDVAPMDATADANPPILYSLCPDGMAPTFSSIATQMLSTGSCGSDQNDCHSSIGARPKPEGGWGSLLDFSLDAASIYQELIGADGGGHNATNVDGDAGGLLLRVASGKADASMLFIKLAPPTDPRFGVAMPPGKTLCPAAIDAVQSWIDNGAAAN
ncbi:MAG: hypothetical protein M3O46_15135 [Myxococcota bacterium]|nr:hypothetical protein [Myxococcota bacterium]